MVYLLEVLIISRACFVLILNSPQWLLSWLIFQVIMVVLLTRSFSRLWVNYIFFLVFLGGLLVIFVYVRRVVPLLRKEYLFNKKGGGIWRAVVSLRVGGNFLFFLSRGRRWGRGSEERLEYPVLGLFFQECRRLYLFVVIYLLIGLFAVHTLLESYEGPLRSYLCS